MKRKRIMKSNKKNKIMVRKRRMQRKGASRPQLEMQLDFFFAFYKKLHTLKLRKK